MTRLTPDGDGGTGYIGRAARKVAAVTDHDIIEQADTEQITGLL